MNEYKLIRRIRKYAEYNFIKKKTTQKNKNKLFFFFFLEKKKSMNDNNRPDKNIAEELYHFIKSKEVLVQKEDAEEEAQKEVNNTSSNSNKVFSTITERCESAWYDSHGNILCQKTDVERLNNYFVKKDVLRILSDEDMLQFASGALCSSEETKRLMHWWKEYKASFRRTLWDQVYHVTIRDSPLKIDENFYYQMQFIKSLDVSGCRGISVLENLPNLVHLDVSSSSIISIRVYSKLQRLLATNCEQLQQINFASSLSKNYALKELSVKNSTRITQDGLPKKLSSLEKLDISFCQNIVSLPIMPQLKELIAQNCSSLADLENINYCEDILSADLSFCTAITNYAPLQNIKSNLNLSNSSYCG